MYHLKNQLDTIIALQNRGYDHDFILDHDGIRCLQYDLLISPDDFQIVEMHQCNENKQSIAIYAIQLNDYDVKGILRRQFEALSLGSSVRPRVRSYAPVERTGGLIYAY
jgi:hypothetical protein